MRRLLTPELMDDPALDPIEHAEALAGLARLNALARSDSILWPPIRDLARRAQAPLRVLDLATGSADVPLALAERAAREGIQLQLHACDASETALREASRRAAELALTIELSRHDVVAHPHPGTFDVVICSLFLHHLDAPDAERFLRHAAHAAGRLLLISDLRRAPAGLLAARCASRLLTRSRIVHVDAVKSVRAAFTPRELTALAASVGLEGARVQSRWPWRMLLQWSRKQHKPVGHNPTR